MQISKRQIAAAAAALLIVAGGAAVWHPTIPPTAPPPGFPQAQIARGAELAAIGDCAVCHTAATGQPCQCGAEELSDHSRHLAQEIIARLGLRPERAANAKDEIRYVSAWFDDVLTKLEGAE